MKIVAVIPARMASSRFPGKPMASIHGMPMIGHCYCRVRLCDALSDTYVATCDEEIVDYIKSIGGKAIMTADTHERASDRAAEAMLKIEESCGQKTDILVMVQGDEPMDTPEMIGEALAPMRQDNTVQVVNLMGRIESLVEFEDPESQDRLTVDTNQYRRDYLAEVESFCQQYREECLQSGIDYVRLDTSMQFDKALTEYLQSRQARF